MYTKEKNKKQSPTYRFVLFLGAICVLMFSALGELGDFRETKSKILDAEGWSYTTGQVIRSGVTYAAKPYLFIFERVGYRPNIQYAYSVDGQNYTGHIHWYDNNTIYSRNDHSRHSNLYKGMLIQEYVARYYPVNKTVSVIYNPYKPSESVLEISDYTTANLQYFFALCIYIAAVLYILYYLKTLFFSRKRKAGYRR